MLWLCVVVIVVVVVVLVVVVVVEVVGGLNVLLECVGGNILQWVLTNSRRFKQWAAPIARKFVRQLICRPKFCATVSRRTKI